MIEHALDQHLDLAAAVLAPGEPRLDHARIVHDQQVAGLHEVRKVAKAAVGEFAVVAVEMQQAAGAALPGRILRYQRGRQLVIEIG